MNPNWTILPGETDQIYSPTANGNYCVVMTDIMGCSDSTCINYTSVAINEIGANMDWNIYPNPNDDTYSIFVNLQNEDIQLSVINLLGEVVSNKTILKSSTNNVILMNHENIPQGIYYVELKTKTTRSIKKLLIW